MTDRYGHPRQSIFGRRHASAAASVSYSTSQHPSHAQQDGAPQQPSHHHHHHPHSHNHQHQLHHHHHPSASIPAPLAAGPAPSSSAATMMGPPAAAPAAVRRNLFQSQLTRRPPPGKGGVAGGVGMGMGMGVGIGVGIGGGGAGGVGGGGLGGLDGADDDDTVVVDEEEEQDADEGDGGIVVRDVHGEVELDEPPFLAVEDPDEIVLDSRQENEKERQRLADAVKQHQSRHNRVPAQPEELFEAVKASLRAKVAALAEDNWMYEKEEEPRLV